MNQGGEMNKLLVATDGSPAAEAAVRAGVQLAEEQGATVVVLHVVEAMDVVAPPFGPVAAVPRELGEPHEDDGLATAAEIAHEHGVPAELKLVSGFDVETILATADEIDAELIAVGSNRHGAIGTIFLGSVSRRLVKLSKRPVLVVHPTPALVGADAIV
jgi:nucleotide-binding universal stress UspA family protein